jgi:hypothetical protein
VLLASEAQQVSGRMRRMDVPVDFKYLGFGNEKPFAVGDQNVLKAETLKMVDDAGGILLPQAG